MLNGMKLATRAAFLVLVSCLPALAETYRSVPLDALIFEGPKEQLATELEQEVMVDRFLRLDARMNLECCLQTDKEANQSVVQGEGQLYFRGGGALPLKGVMDLAGDYAARQVRSVPFTILEGTTKTLTEKEFLAARQQWARVRAEDRVAGTPWFRHLSGHANDPADGVMEPTSMLDTFSLFSGGRAIADNLALNRDLILAEGEDTQRVRIDTIEGVEVRAIDWSRRLPQGELAIDPLAAFVPEDQHALFAPSLPGLLALLERANGELQPLAGSLLGGSFPSGLLPRYRRQLGLDVTDAAARLLPLRSVAVTGGDPYFSTGTDVAVLMETSRAAALLKALELAVRAQSGAKPERHTGEGLERLSFVLPDKGISSHLCRMGDLVMVTNSLAQVRRVHEVVQGAAPALGATDEFRFFRHRYPAEGESAYLFLSDATIRRWAGPVTRIGASRRNRALAALNELTCRELADCGRQEDYAALLGRVAMMDGRVISERYGSAGFLTPISELGMAEVSVIEQEAYRQWKGGYESGWGKFFDPIAIQLRLADDSVDVDLTVLPLKVDSRMMGLLGIAGESTLSPRARMRPQGSALRLACAVDSKGEFFKEFETGLVSFLPELTIKPLSWLGESVSVDLMDSLFWQSGPGFGMGETLGQMPVVVRCEVKSKLKLSLFLTAARAKMQTSAPDVLQWVNRKHGKHSYVVISEREPDEFGPQLQVCYAITGDSLLLSLDERLLRQAMDFELRQWPAADMARQPQARSMLLDAAPSILSAPQRMLGGAAEGADRAAQTSWSALPILNQWRQRFPDQDPVAVHQRLFGVELCCPGGRGYRWNAEQLTMESVVYGHRGAPRRAADKDGWSRYGRVLSAIDFEDDGMRLRLHLGPARPLASLPQPEPGEVLGTAAQLSAFRAGRSLSYETTGPGAEETWGVEIVSVVETPEGKLVSTREPWAWDGEQGVWEGRYLLNETGVWQLGGKDEFSTATNSEPALSLPAELRRHAVHRHQSKGTNVHEDNGVKEVEATRSRDVIRVLGSETVEVGAGTFEDCVLIERSTETLHGEYFDSQTIREWYHPGTGLVQSRYEDGTLSKLSSIKDKE